MDTHIYFLLYKTKSYDRLQRKPTGLERKSRRKEEKDFGKETKKNHKVKDILWDAVTYRKNE